MTTAHSNTIHTSYIQANRLEVSLNKNCLLIKDPAQNQEQTWQWDDVTFYLSPSENSSLAGLYASLECIFNLHPEKDYVSINDPENLFASELLTTGIAQSRSDALQISQALFWQAPYLWLNREPTPPYPQKYILTQNKRHPLRPPKRSGVLYQRFIPWLNQTLSFRSVDLEHDLVYFHRWMNDSRVAHFWEEEGSKEHHLEYLEKSAADAHSQSIIGCFNGKPFAYFEIYWAKEDRIAPFYDVIDYDRGWHLLVGEEEFRGRKWFSAWFPSLQHYLFLDDPRTQRIVAEPRHDNERLIRHAQTLGFANIKAFDFPHKRAQLLMLLRERFFEEYCLHPLR